MTVALLPRAWTVADARTAFAALVPPEPEDLIGAWDGELIGRPSLQLRTRIAAAPTPFRGWCGKTFLDPTFAVNRVRRHGYVRHGLAGRAVVRASRLDGNLALVVSYRATAPWPWTHFRGELRAVSDDQLLGLLMLTFGRLMIGPFPFRLIRV